MNGILSYRNVHPAYQTRPILKNSQKGSPHHGIQEKTIVLLCKKDSLFYPQVGGTLSDRFGQIQQQPRNIPNNQRRRQQRGRGNAGRTVLLVWTEIYFYKQQLKHFFFSVQTLIVVTMVIAFKCPSSIREPMMSQLFAWHVQK